MLGHKQIPSRAGGVEIVVEELAVRMAQKGHGVVCYNRSGGKGGYCGVCLRGIPALHRKGLEAVTSSFFAASAAAFGDADVVHIHGEGPAFWCWIPKLSGKRVVVTIHGLDWQREKWHGGLGAKFIYAGEKAAVRYADDIIVLSQNAQQYFRDTYSRETVRIPNGVSVPKIRAAEKIRQYGLHKDGYLLFLGRLVPEKGIHYLIEAFRNVRTEKKLVIAGASSDTDTYARHLKTLAAEDARIVFTGFVQGEMLAELYSNAYVYVLPSDLEGMPLSLLEAMSYGNCCVVSDIPECTEAVGDSAVTFPGGDVTALRECLQNLCEAPELAAQYKRNAASAVLDRFCWDDVVERTLEVYHENSADQ